MAKEGYLPRYMESIFRGSTRNLGFTIKDFSDYKNDKVGIKGTNTAIRIVIANMLFAEYKDHTLVAFFTGVNPIILRQWQNKYYNKNKDPLIAVIESKIKTRK
jgi:hypothetical protein